MAVIIGLVEFRGSMGNLVAYKMNGKLVVRRKPNVSKFTRLNAKGYKKTRENAAEFGKASKAGKLLRHAMDAIYRFGCDNKAYYRITQLMTDILKLDTISDKGKRSIAEGMKVNDAIEMLQNFEFNANQRVPESLKKKISVEDSFIKISKFNPVKYSVHVKDATRVNIEAAIMWIDFEGERSHTIEMNEYALKIEDKETDLIFSPKTEGSAKGICLCTVGITFFREKRSGGFENLGGGMALILGE